MYMVVIKEIVKNYISHLKRFQFQLPNFTAFIDSYLEIGQSAEGAIYLQIV